MLSLDCTILSAVCDRALQDAVNHPRWQAAISRAVVELLSNPYVERGDDSSLIIGSTSGKAYASNGVCQCTAYQFNQPCWHRAAARLVRLHDERQTRAQHQDAETNPVCRACHTDAYPASGMQPAFCTECVQAMLHGRSNRLQAAQRTRSEINARQAQAQATLDELYA